MRLSLFEEQRSAALPVALLVVARIANLMLGLAVIPVLIHYLGGDGFAAWALLLAIGAALALLELGMALTYVKEVAPLIQHEDWRQATPGSAPARSIPKCIGPRNSCRLIRQ